MRRGRPVLLPHLAAFEGLVLAVHGSKAAGPLPAKIGRAALGNSSAGCGNHALGGALVCRDVLCLKGRNAEHRKAGYASRWQPRP